MFFSYCGWLLNKEVVVSLGILTTISNLNTLLCLLCVNNITTGSDRPTLDDLCKFVTPHCAAQWKFIGKRLNFTPTSLKAMHDGNHGDDNKCCDALWSKWLDTDPQATWEKLIFAIGILLLSFMG